MGSVREGGILAVVEEAVAPAAVADEEQRGQEDQGTDGAGFPLQQEAEEVEAHEHGVVEPESWVQRLGDEQHGEQPLQAVHPRLRLRRRSSRRLVSSGREKRAEVEVGGDGSIRQSWGDAG